MSSLSTLTAVLCWLLSWMGDTARTVTIPIATMLRHKIFFVFMSGSFRRARQFLYFFDLCIRKRLEAPARVCIQQSLTREQSRSSGAPSPKKNPIDERIRLVVILE